MTATKKSILTEEDADDFNNALSLLYIGSCVGTVIDVDTGVHLRNLCNVAVGMLCNIRHRINPGSIEVKA